MYFPSIVATRLSRRRKSLCLLLPSLSLLGDRASADLALTLHQRLRGGRLGFHSTYQSLGGWQAYLDVHLHGLGRTSTPAFEVEAGAELVKNVSRGVEGVQYLSEYHNLGEIQLRLSALPSIRFPFSAQSRSTRQSLVRPLSLVRVHRKLLVDYMMECRLQKLCTGGFNMALHSNRGV